MTEPITSAPAHIDFQARLTACFEGRVVSDPRQEPYFRQVLGLDDGTWAETANYQAMLAASWLWRVLLTEVEPGERRLAFAQVVKLYELEREQGMYRGECLCPDPHAGMHLEAHTAILCAALEHPRPKLMNLALDWLGRALRLYVALAAPDGEPWAPGLRTKTPLPRNQAAAALVREVLGLPHRREKGQIVAAEKLEIPGTSRSPYYFASLRWLRRLLAERPMLRRELRHRATTAPFPEKLLLPLRLTRFEGGLLATLEQPPRPPRTGWLDPVDWLLVHWSSPGKHEAQAGRAWATPPPSVPKGARILERLAVPAKQ